MMHRVGDKVTMKSAWPDVKAGEEVTIMVVDELDLLYPYRVRSSSGSVLQWVKESDLTTPKREIQYADWDKLTWGCVIRDIVSGDLLLTQDPLRNLQKSNCVYSTILSSKDTDNKSIRICKEDVGKFEYLHHIQDIYSNIDI